MVTLYVKANSVFAARQAAAKRGIPTSPEMGSQVKELAMIYVSGYFQRVIEWYCEPVEFPCPNGTLMLYRDGEVAGEGYEMAFPEEEGEGEGNS